MSASILWSLAPQGSEEWLEIRRGAVTGSIADIARDRSDGLTAQQRIYVNARKAGYGEAEAMELAKYKAKPKAEIVDRALAGDLPLVWSDPAILKARDLARERVGGRTQDVFQTAALRLGKAEEPKAREIYEERTGFLVEEVGFAYTEDRRFGCSVDGIVHMPEPSPRPWLWECKTIVSSDLLFKAVLDGDISEWAGQCLFNTWLLTAAGIRLYLHVWDLPELSREFVLPRDEAAIEALEADMVAFEKLVSANERQLRIALGEAVAEQVVDEVIAAGNPPWSVEPAQPAPMAAPITTAPALLAPAF